MDRYLGAMELRSWINFDPYGTNRLRATAG